jgi:hypothetical protein
MSRTPHHVTVLRWCRVAFWANLVMIVCLGGVFFSLHESQPRIRGLLVEFRNSLITRSASNLFPFTSTPGDLVSHDFYTDSPAMIEAWRSRLSGVVPSVEAASSRDEIDRVKAVVLSFSKGGGGRPIYRMPLLDKIVEAQRGSGFCSDYVEIFLALSEVNGLTAREVQNEVHGFADFYSPSRGKWIFVDPQHAILAADGSGAYLSSLEIRQLRAAGLPVHFMFFGTADRAINSEADPRFQALYGDASRFKRYVLTYGNNVLTEASRSEALAFLPWEARQLYLYLSGTKPHLLFLPDSFADRRAREAEQWYGLVFFAISGYFVVALGCYPCLCLVRRCMRAAATHPKQTNGSSVA